MRETWGRGGGEGKNPNHTFLFFPLAGARPPSFLPPSPGLFRQATGEGEDSGEARTECDRSL